MNGQRDKAVTALIRQTVQKHGYIDLPASGYSMFPYIREGSVCRFMRCKASELCKGDIVLYVSETDQLVAHRFYQTFDADGRLLYLCKGDSNIGFDLPIQDTQLIGKLASMRPGGNHSATGSWFLGKYTATAWSTIVMNIPYVSFLLNRYVHRRKLRSTMSGVSR